MWKGPWGRDQSEASTSDEGPGDPLTGHGLWRLVLKA